MRCVACLTIAAAAGVAAAGVSPTVPFTETFDDGAANWLDGGFLPAQYIETGGVDGSGFVRAQTGFELADPGSFNVAFRGNTGLFPGTDASGGAFIGDWIAGGVTSLSFSIRHNIDVPATFFARIAANTNGAAFPGAVAIEFAPVVAGQWTEITIDIDPNNPAFVSFSGATFESIFSNVGFVQIGVASPEALLGDPRLFDIDLDNVSIVPVPGVLAFGVPAVAALGVRRRR